MPPIHIMPLIKEYSKKTFFKVARQRGVVYARSCGGVWVVFCETDDRQVNARRYKLMGLSLPAETANWFKKYLSATPGKAPEA